MCLISGTTVTEPPHDQPLTICNIELLLFGKEKGENGAAPLILQWRCEGQNASADRSPSAGHSANVQESRYLNSPFWLLDCGSYN